MVNQSLVVIGAGSLPELSMRNGVQSLADGLSLPLCTVATGETPDRALERIVAAEPSLVRLAGDPGRLDHQGRSWIEALGAWRMPTLMLGAPLGDGAIPGAVPAFLALCQQHRVPLVGLVQLGGAWRPMERRLDGLPWLGWLAEIAPDCAENSQRLDQVMALVAQRLSGFSSALATGQSPHQS